MFDLGSLLNLALSGITFGMILFLLAAGFELMFGVMRIINMAHGSFFMLGAYVGISIIRQTHHFLFGIIVGAMSVGVVGLVTERFLFRRLQQPLQQVFVTFGIIYVLADLSRMVWGATPYVLSTPGLLAGSISIMGKPFPFYRLVLLGVGLLIALGLWLFQEKTRLGSIIRAGVDDREMVGLIGINIKLLSTAVFAGGAFLAGFAGVMASPIIPVLPGIDWDVMTLAMVVVVVGGLGSLRGALVGGLLIGLADTFGKFLLPQVGIILIFLILAIVLIIKPSGIFGEVIMGRLISKVDRINYSGYWPIMMALIGFLLVFPWVASYYSVILITEILIYAIFATSLNLELGFTGLASLGHAAFFGVGGYTLGILVSKLGMHNFWICMVAVILASGVVSSIFGYFAIRTAGAFFIMLTFALAQFIWAIAWSWRLLTGGDDGISGVARPVLGLSVSMGNEVNFYYLVLLFFVIAIFFLYRLCRSPFGHVLQGIRDSEMRMQVLGYDTWKYKYVAFIVAGIFAGVAGAFKAYQDGLVSPAYSSVLTSGMVLLMCMVGGTRVFLGPALGAATMWTIRSVVSSHTEYWSFVLGAILIIVVMFAPQGIAGYLVQIGRVLKRAGSKS